jgi:hypothetical protein
LARVFACLGLDSTIWRGFGGFRVNLELHLNGNGSHPPIQPINSSALEAKDIHVKGPVEIIYWAFGLLRMVVTG